MLCDKCKKEEAKIHFTEIINDKIFEVHLCEKCAQIKGIEIPLDNTHFSIVDLLASLSAFEPSLKIGKKSEQKCSNCGISFEDFKQKGHLGCSQCYSTFSDQLGPLLERIHGCDQYVGKKPAHKEPQKNKRFLILQNLKEELTKVIKGEEYEKAAIIRDKIKKIESKKLKSNNEGNKNK